MSETDRRASKATLVVLVLAGLVGGALAFRAILREVRDIAALPPMVVLGRVPDFSLKSQDGADFNADDLAGNVWVADFIFTRCAGPCPRMTRRMADLQNRLAANPMVRFVSFTVDPENDTPPVLKKYAALFNADLSRWSFLTGENRFIRDLAISGFKLSVDVDPDDEQTIIHSTRFVLVDQQRRIRGYYDENDSEAMQQLVADIQRLADDPEPE